jgi:hypothetical protein
VFKRNFHKVICFQLLNIVVVKVPMYKWHYLVYQNEISIKRDDYKSQILFLFVRYLCIWNVSLSFFLSLFFFSMSDKWMKIISKKKRERWSSQILSFAFFLFLLLLLFFFCWFFLFWNSICNWSDILYIFLRSSIWSDVCERYKS